MKIYKGETLTAIFNNFLRYKATIAYQLSFAYVVLSFTLLSVALMSAGTVFANERDVQRRTEAVLERMLENQAARSLEIVEFLQETQLQSYTEQQIENTVSQTAEDIIEEQINVQQADAFGLQEALSSTEQIRHLNRRISELNHLTYEDHALQINSRFSATRDPLEPEPGIEITEDVPDQDLPNEEQPVEELPEEELPGGDLGSYDPTESEQPSDKGNDEVEEDTSDQVDEEVEDTITSNADDALNDSLVSANFDVTDLQFEQVLTGLHNDAHDVGNIDEKAVWTNQWVIMADEEAKDILELEGYEFSNEEHLAAFGSIIANVKAPASYDLFEDYQQIMKKLNKHDDDAVLDLNHVYTNIYTNATQINSGDADGLIPGKLMSIPGKGVRIGMVDTAIDTNHKYLKHANIVQQHFTQDGRDPVYEHGTAVASVFTGASQDYRGIIEGAQLYNASVFIEANETQSVTTALSLMKGLNWLVQQDIKVINMSLAGPPNRLLQKGIQQLCQQGIVIVAAAGNEGPFAKPMYPAGYGCAVAVTAVDAKNQLYKKAVRGDHIDVAAYGVDIMAASKRDTLTSQSGTSIAAPFVSAWIASQLPENDLANNWLELALDNCIDLGVKGIDPLYGKGLLPFDSLQLVKLQPFNHLELILHR